VAEAAGEITSHIITGPAEMVGEYGDPGEAAAGKANMELFLKWALAGDASKPPPPVILILSQAKLNPEQDRPRKSDWAKMPDVRLEGTNVDLDAPRSKFARDIVRKVLTNSKPKRIFDRPKKGGAGGGGRIVAIAAAVLILIGGAVVGYLKFSGKL
jgi:hypothetical protein